MSLVSFIGPRPNLLDLKGTSRHMRLEVSQPILTNEELERIRTDRQGVVENPFRTATIDITYDVANGPEYMEAALEAICAGAERAVQRRLQHHHPLRPRRVGRARADSRPARHLGHPSSSDPQGPSHLGRPGGRIGRAARGASVLHACRLWRRGDQPLSRLRDARGHAARARREDHAEGARQALHQGASTRASSRSCPRWASRPTSPIAGPRSSMPSASPTHFVAQIFHRHRHPDRRRRPRARSPRRRSAAMHDAFGGNPVYADALDVGGDYAYRIRGEAACLDARDGGQPAACGARQHARTFRRLRQAWSTSSREQLKTLRGLFRIRTAGEMGRTPVAARRGRAGQPPSSGAFRPAPCPSARSAARRTPPSPSP